MYYQQGDLLLKSAKALPPNAEKLDHKILLKSVDRDNAHRFDKEAPVILFRGDDQLYVDVGETAALIHDEHKHIDIAPGLYLMDQVREFDPTTEEVRKVID